MFVWFSLRGYVSAFFASLLVIFIAMLILIGLYFAIYKALTNISFISRNKMRQTERKRFVTFTCGYVFVCIALSGYIFYQNFFYVNRYLVTNSSQYLSKTDIVIEAAPSNSFLITNKVGNKPIRFYTVDRKDKLHTTVSYVDVPVGGVENNRNIDKSVNVPLNKAGDMESEYEGNGLINDGFNGTKVILMSSNASYKEHSDDRWFVINHSDERIDIIDNERPSYMDDLQPVDPHRMIVE